MRTKYSFLLFMILLLCTVLSACSSDGSSPIRVTPIDTSADMMGATIQIMEDQNSTDRSSVVSLQMGIDDIIEDNYAYFSHGEYVTCNSVKVVMGGTPLYTFKVDSTNGYTCTYRGFQPGAGLLSAVTLISVAARSRLDPQQPLFSRLGYTITYTPDASDHACLIAAVASDSSDNPITGKPSFSDSGIYSGPDIASLSGTGEIVLTRTCSWAFQNPFGKVDLTYISTASVDVTWSH